MELVCKRVHAGNETWLPTIRGSEVRNIDGFPQLVPSGLVTRLATRFRITPTSGLKALHKLLLQRGMHYVRTDYLASHDGQKLANVATRQEFAAIDLSQQARFCQTASAKVF